MIVFFAPSTGCVFFLYVVRRTRPTAGVKNNLVGPPHCNENPIFVFLFWELRGLSPNFHIHVSMSDLYINRSQSHECGNSDCGRAIPFLGIFVSNFRILVLLWAGGPVRQPYAAVDFIPLSWIYEFG
jgi:hypothetical protein